MESNNDSKPRISPNVVSDGSSVDVSQGRLPRYNDHTAIHEVQTLKIGQHFGKLPTNPRPPTEPRIKWHETWSFRIPFFLAVGFATAYLFKVYHI